MPKTLATLIPRKALSGVESSEAVFIPENAVRAVIAVDLDPSDYRNPTKHFHLAVYTSRDGGQSFQLIEATARFGGPCGARDGIERPRLFFQEDTGLHFEQGALKGIQRIRGAHVRVRAAVGQRLPLAADPMERVRNFELRAVRFSERLDAQGLPELEEFRIAESESIEIGVEIEIEVP